MTETELDTKIAALREQLLGSATRIRGARRAAVSGDLIRYELALREKYGMPNPYAPRCEPADDEPIFTEQDEAE